MGEWYPREPGPYQELRALVGKQCLGGLVLHAGFRVSGLGLRLWQEMCEL